VQVNPRAVASLGLSLDDVRTAIASQNVNQAKGSFDGPQRSSTIDATITAFARRLPQIVSRTATVRRCGCRTWPPWSTVPEHPPGSMGQPKPAIVLSIQRQPGPT